MISNEQTRQIINAMVNHKTLDVPDNIQEVAQVFKDHSLIHQLYFVFKDQRLKKYYLSAAIIYEKQSAIIANIKNIFNKSNIDFILLKGSVIRNIYPYYFLRMQGDIDVLVRESNFEFAKEKLINEGFIQECAWSHHIQFKKDNLVIELHNFLFGDKNLWNGYFIMPFANAHIKDEHEYEFNNLYFVMYEIAHLAKHFTGDGAGLRPFIDFYYIFSKSNINFMEIKSECKKINLDKFFNSIINVLNYFFNYDKVEFEPIDCLDDYIQMIKQSGIHGHSKNSNYYANRFASKRQSKISYYLSILFPSHSKMKLLYPYLNKHPLLFPFARIARIFSCIFVKSKNIKKIEGAKKDISRYKNIYEEIGLRH